MKGLSLLINRKKDNNDLNLDEIENVISATGFSWIETEEQDKKADFEYGPETRIDNDKGIL